MRSIVVIFLHLLLQATTQNSDTQDAMDKDDSRIELRLKSFEARMQNFENAFGETNETLKTNETLTQFSNELKEPSGGVSSSKPKKKLTQLEKVAANDSVRQKREMNLKKKKSPKKKKLREIDDLQKRLDELKAMNPMMSRLPPLQSAPPLAPINTSAAVMFKFVKPGAAVISTCVKQLVLLVVSVMRILWPVVKMVLQSVIIGVSAGLVPLAAGALLLYFMMGAMAAAGTAGSPAFLPSLSFPCPPLLE